MFSSSDRYIIVNYHYVREADARYPGIFPCAPDEFRRQIKFLSERYKIVSVEDVWDAALKGKKGKYSALTFDDGLKDQYENALPILKERNAKAVFFIIGSVFDGILPSSHALHILMSFFAMPELLSLFQSFLKGQHPLLQEKYHIPSDRRLTSRRMHEDVRTANFKETIMRIPQEMKNEFITAALSEIKKETNDIIEMLFMKEEEIKELKKNGMHIGSHSYAHTPFEGKTKEQVENDLEHANAILSKYGPLSPVFSYPHGRRDEAAVRALENKGFHFAVTIERRGVKKEDNPFLIPRYDAGDLTSYL